MIKSAFCKSSGMEYTDVCLRELLHFIFISRTITFEYVALCFHCLNVSAYQKILNHFVNRMNDYCSFAIFFLLFFFFSLLESTEQ